MPERKKKEDESGLGKLPPKPETTKERAIRLGIIPPLKKKKEDAEPKKK